MNHLNFVWDPVKARRNLQKHGISFQEATSVFDDPLALIFEDARYAYGECREIIIGHDRQNRLMLVCFVEQPTVIRLISARLTTPRETRDYEQQSPDG